MHPVPVSRGQWALTCACARQRTSAHLLIEKPLCTTVEDCLKVEEMQKADKHAGWRVI
jgi:hypothetical protein